MLEDRSRDHYYDNHLTIILNGGKWQISAENIPINTIEKSLDQVK